MEKRIRSLDGTIINIEIWDSKSPVQPNGILVAAHGINSEHTEAGLYTSLAEKLAERNFKTIALDLRSHGKSEGQQKDFTISGAITDICAAIETVNTYNQNIPLYLVGASFSGGMILHIAEHLKRPDKIVLLNPRINYTPWLYQSTLYSDGILTESNQLKLQVSGHVERNEFKLGKEMINELATFRVGSPSAIPTLVLHGDSDRTIPIEETRSYFNKANDTEFITVPNADHGFVAKGEQLGSLNSTKLRKSVVATIVEYITSNHGKND